MTSATMRADIEAPQKPTKSNEWYTPSYILEAAREVMGGIDLDPASCALANETVKATRYFTKHDDGLAQAWSGRTWLNPPYSLEGTPRGMISPRESIVKLWIVRLIAEYKGGHVSEAILLTKADPKQRWFQPLWEFPICFHPGKVIFNRPDAPPEGHMFGSVFVYLGPHEDAFINVFQHLGTVARCIAPHLTK